MEHTPRQIGRYRIERRLGSGSMGHVYLARDLDLDRPVAVKTLRDVDLDDETRALFLGRFQNEAKAAARLQHPNIVQIFDVGDDPDQGPYLVFEYVPGHTLKEQLRKSGPLRKEQLLTVAQQIADALTTAHMAGVIHRDLKPENLLITENGLLKLADFGIARVPNADLTKEGQFLGTPCYAAPETLLKGEYSTRTDLFSFGAVLYEAASGERAFPGTEAMVVAQNVMHRDPVPPSEANRAASIPRLVDQVILQSLDKNPERRFESARALVSALRAAYEGKSSERGSRSRRRASVLFLLALGVAVGTWALLDRNRLTESPTEMPIDAGVITEIPTSEDSGVTAATHGALDAGIESDAREHERPLSPHEREEAAKDELDRARQALEDGDMAAAEAALDRAAEFDPHNPDIGVLRTEARRADDNP